MAKEHPKVHTIDGKKYVEVARMAKLGDMVMIDDNSEHAGMIGTVEYFEYRHGISVNVGDVLTYYPFVFENEYRVLEPIDQSPQSLDDIIANLTRRLAEVETELAGVKNTAHKALSATGNHGEWLIRNQERLVALESEITFTPAQLASLIDVYRGGTTHD